MVNKKHKSLAAQFFSMIAIVIMIFMSVNAFVQYKNHTHSINHLLKERIESIAGLLATVSIEPLLTFDDVTLDSYAEFVSKQDDIVFAVVVNEKGIPLTHFINYRNKYIKKITSSDNVINIKPVIEKLSKEKYILTLKKKIIFENEVLAYSWVGLDRYPYVEESLYTLRDIILFFHCSLV